MPTLAACALVLTTLAACGGGGRATDRSRDAERTPSAETTSGSAEVTPTTPPAATPALDGACFNQPATLVGTRGDDNIKATPRRDVILTLAGNDRITGLRDRDIVCAGPGDDIVNDVGTSASTKGGVHYNSEIRIDSGPGDDDLTVGTAFRVHTGSGDDHLTVTHTAIIAHLGSGNDHLVSTGWGVDSVYLEGGNDQVDNDSPERDAALRTCVQFDRRTTNMRVDLSAGKAVSSVDHTHQIGLHHIHCVRLGGGRNLVYGTPDDDQITAGSGDVVVYAGDGRDLIGGGAGNDRIYAGGGQDSSSGAGGNDIIYAGPGNDFAGGGNGNDHVYGEDGNDNLEGYAGADHLEGGPGDDDLYAGSECDTSVHRGGGGLVDSQPNELYGGDGDDQLVGDKGADHLDGGPGNDEGGGGWRDPTNNFITSIETSYPGCGVDF